MPKNGTLIGRIGRIFAWDSFERPNVGRRIGAPLCRCLTVLSAIDILASYITKKHMRAELSFRTIVDVLRSEYMFLKTDSLGSSRKIKSDKEEIMQPSLKRKLRISPTLRFLACSGAIIVSFVFVYPGA